MSLPVPGGFAGVKESSFDALDGTYDAVLGTASVKDAKDDTIAKWQKKGHEGEKHPGVITWEFNITTEGYENRKVWHRTSLTTEGKPMVLAVLLALGHNRAELDSPDYAIDLEAEFGKPVQLKCKPDTNDDTQTRVRAIMRPGAATGSSLLP